MDLLILGAGGHGRVVKEVAEAIGKYNRIAFLDDAYDGTGNCDGSDACENSATCDISAQTGNPDVIGKFSDCEKYLAEFTHAFVAIGNPRIRNRWQEKLAAIGYQIPVLIHPYAYISPSAYADIGTVVMPRAVVQGSVRIGESCIISSGAIVDHNAVIGNYCHINAGAIVAAGSRVEDFIKVDYGEVYRDDSNKNKSD